MRKVLQYLFEKPIVYLANRFSAAPKAAVVNTSLTKILKAEGKKNNILKINAIVETAKFIIFSDQHKGDKTAADDFKNNEPNYVAALNFYNKLAYSFINLGDAEELWKFKPTNILPNNKTALAAEAAFQQSRFFKTFGNHDIIWKNKADVFLLLRKYFNMPLPIYEGIVINLIIKNYTLKILLTHGHQGDAMSDNNGFSTWMVAHLWMPIQRLLQININTPSNNFTLRNKHNIMMSNWSAKQENLILITGHTHVPVFASGKYYNHPANHIPGSEKLSVKPTYFNTGCCCYNDGDITGIEIADGYIRLIKWHFENDTTKRLVLEEIAFEKLILDL